MVTIRDVAAAMRAEEERLLAMRTINADRSQVLASSVTIAGSCMVIALAGISILVGAIAVTLAPLLEAGVGLPLAAKFVISALLIAPAGFLMGMPFPAGLTRLEQRHSPSVRWAWALNAAASVLGSVSATVLAIHVGLRETLLAGGALYLLALASVALSRQPREVPAAAVSVSVP